MKQPNTQCCDLLIVTCHFIWGKAPKNKVEIEGNLKLWMQGNAGVWRCCGAQQDVKNRGQLTVLEFAKAGKQLQPTIPNGTLLQTTVAYFATLSPQSFGRNFLQFSIVAADLYSNVCKYFWLGPSLANGGHCSAWAKFYVKSRTGGFVCCSDTIGYGEFTTAINPSNGRPSCTVPWTEQYNEFLYVSHIWERADCETINYLTCQ